MGAAAVPGNTRAKWLASVDLVLNVRKAFKTPANPGKMPNSAQRTIEIPRSIAPGVSPYRAICATTVQVQLVGSQGALAPARRAVKMSHADANSCPAPLVLLLPLHREAAESAR